MYRARGGAILRPGPPSNWLFGACAPPTDVPAQQVRLIRAQGTKSRPTGLIAPAPSEAREGSDLPATGALRLRLESCDVWRFAGGRCAAREEAGFSWASSCSEAFSHLLLEACTPKASHS